MKLPELRLQSIFVVAPIQATGIRGISKSLNSDVVFLEKWIR